MSTAAAPWSLRRRLLALLLGLTLTLWGGSVAIVYVETQRESLELFDQALLETGRLLLSLADTEAHEHGSVASLDLRTATATPRGRELLFQLRDRQQRLVYTNAQHSGADLPPLAPLAGTGAAAYSWAEIGARRYRVYSGWNDEHNLQVQLAEPISHLEEISSRFFYNTAQLGTLLAVLAALGIWLLINRLFRVLRESAEAVATRTPSDLAEVDLASAPREVAPLLEAINRLFGQVRRTRENEQRFTADAAHELRTPLAAIKTNLQVLQRARNPAEHAECVAGLGASVERASRLVGQLLTLARLDPQQDGSAALPPLDLAALLEEEAPHWQTPGAGRRVTLHTASAPCAGQADSLRILLQNLVDNALRYTPENGTIRVSCGQDAQGSYLEVADDGPGIPDAMREKVFERFFRLAGAQTPGSGLGLSIVRRIADLHGAQLTLGPGLQGQGLGVTLRFPRARQP